MTTKSIFVLILFGVHLLVIFILLIKMEIDRENLRAYFKMKVRSVFRSSRVFSNPNLYLDETDNEEANKIIVSQNKKAKITYIIIAFTVFLVMILGFTGVV